jgi:large subunit ribosomal protein L10
MNRQGKEQVIESLKNDFAKSPASFVVSYKGLTVAQVQELRRSLNGKGGSLKVAKARLMKRAVSGLEGAQDLAPYLKEQIALVFSQKDPSAIAKALVDFAKNNDKLNVVAGSVDSKMMDKKTIQFFASLPSREILLAQLCGVLKAPVAKLAYTLSAVKEQK